MKIDCVKKTMVILAALTFGCAVAFAGSAPDSNSPAQRNRGPAAQRPARDFMQELSEKLNLTDEQKAAIKPILATEANEIKTVHQDSSLSNEQKQAKIKEVRDNSREKINALLTTEQQKKFAEMKGQAGNRTREESQNRPAAMLSEKLNLTDAQKTAIEPILATEANEIKAVHLDSSLSNEQKQAKIKEIRDNSREKTNALLTTEQQKKFAEMKGQVGSKMREAFQNRLTMIAEKLNLTDEQKTAIKPILVTEVNDITAVMQDNSLSKEQKQSKTSDIREASDKKINTLLTPEQQAKWAQLKENAKKERNKKDAPGK